MAAYSGFARVYDALMGERDSMGWRTKYAQKLLACDLRSGQKLLDAGCGTGYLSVAMAQAGYRVTGADNSAAMLEQAAEAARKAGVQVALYPCDIANEEALAELGRFAAVTAACDPVNYLPDPAGFFRGAARCLRPGGVLMFDVCTPAYYAALGAERVAEVLPDAAAILDTVPTDCGCEMTLTLFTRRQNGSYFRTEETHSLFGHGYVGLMKVLTEAGFSQVSAEDFATGRTAEDTNERWLFTARR